MASANEEAEGGESQPIDLRLVLNLIAYGLRSVVRHRYMATGLFSVVFFGTVSILYLLPKTYHVESRLFAQENSALALKGDNQAQGAPSRSAEETIMQRDNMVAIVRQTDLLHEWYERRAPLAHLKDVIARAISRPETEQETAQWMADVLEKKMRVWSPAEGVIQIALDWPDPEMAVRLVEASVHNYLEARRAIEVTAIEEQGAILNNHATSLRADIDTSVDAIERLRAKRLLKAAPSAAPSSSSAPSPTAPPPTSVVAIAPRPHPQELARLKALIEAKQRAISELEEFRRRRLAELNATLAEKSATYTANHPVIIDLRQNIASFSQESPEAQRLRTEVDGLQQELDDKLAAANGDSFTPGHFPALDTGEPQLPGNIIRIEQEPADDRDPEMMYARTQLRDAMEKYSSLRAQIESAQIDLDTAQAAFKYRYTVVEPPLYPKGPSKPNPLIVVLGGFVGGVLVSILAAIAAELRKGRFAAAWQVERALDLPLLAEMDVATLAEHKLTE